MDRSLYTRFAVASLNQKCLDFEGNKNRILEVLNDCLEKGVDFVCLPELCITGYGCEDHFLSEEIISKSIETTIEITNQFRDTCLVFNLGFPLRVNGNTFNTQMLYFSHGDDNEWPYRGFRIKHDLANDGIHYEKRWFQSGYDISDNSYLHDLIDSMYEKYSKLEFDRYYYEILSKKHILNFRNCYNMGFEICEEAWVADRDLSGLNLVFNPSASHFSLGKRLKRESMIINASRQMNGVYLYSNLLGNESGKIIYDGGCYIAYNGNIINETDRFSKNSYELVYSDILNEEVSNLSTNKTHDKKIVVSVGYDRSGEDELADYSYKPSKPIEIDTSYDKFEEFENSCVLGLHDYMKKSSLNGFTLSLSGGVDSSVVAILVYEMAKKYNIDLNGMFYCMYQGTENSSTETYNRAKDLCAYMGIKLLNHDIDSIVNSYVRNIENIVNKKFNWEDDDITLQNIQARVRSPGIWMIANYTNTLLLTTGNRSEITVGYCTMDGDTSGCLNPIGGVSKIFLFEYLEWKLNNCEESIDYIFKHVLTQLLNSKPTAELRKDGHSDEEDLMPYDILDYIENLVIKSKLGKDLVIKSVIHRFSDRFSEIELVTFVYNFYKFFHRNQWKRERYAPSFHLDDHSMDPKTWARFPILSKLDLSIFDKWIQNKF